MLACLAATRGLSSSSALLASVALLWAFYQERLHGFEGGVELVHARHPGDRRLLTDAHTEMVQRRGPMYACVAACLVCMHLGRSVPGRARRDAARASGRGRLGAATSRPYPPGCGGGGRDWGAEIRGRVGGGGGRGGGKGSVRGEGRGGGGGGEGRVNGAGASRASSPPPRRSGRAARGPPRRVRAGHISPWRPTRLASAPAPAAPTRLPG
jgi:hypothetical protein